MVKPILYYALVRAYRHTVGFEVLGVTSEAHRQVYGRGEDGGLTHVPARNILHRFPEGATEAFAKDAAKRAREEYDRHEVAIRVARDEVSRLEQIRAERTLAAAKGDLKPQPLPGLCMLGDRCHCHPGDRPGCDNWRNQDHSPRFEL